MTVLRIISLWERMKILSEGEGGEGVVLGEMEVVGVMGWVVGVGVEV